MAKSRTHKSDSTNADSATSGAHKLTIKSARAAGFREKKEIEYGGEEIIVEGRTLIRNAEVALSKTEWRRKGFHPIKGTTPHAQPTIHLHRRGYQKCEYYRADQVELTQKPSPEKTIPLLAATWVINRRAKRCRDLAEKYYTLRMHGFAQSASHEKDELYGFKGQVLQHLINEGTARIVGHHRFPNGNLAELVECDGYFFHRPCAALEGSVASERHEIEAKPRDVKEPRLKDALHTVQEYLKGKPRLDVYCWPSKARAQPERNCKVYTRSDGPEAFDDIDSDFYE